MNRRFTQVDVFTDTALRGNPLAVVHDAHGLGDAQMQAFARWTNLSETTFLLPPTDPAADYRVRIFTPQRELPFAGHPTLGSCHAWLEGGGVARVADEVVQQCAAGLIRIRRQAGRLAFAAPPCLRPAPRRRRPGRVPRQRRRPQPHPCCAWPVRWRPRGSGRSAGSARAPRAAAADLAAHRSARRPKGPAARFVPAAVRVEVRSRRGDDRDRLPPQPGTSGTAGTAASPVLAWAAARSRRRPCGTAGVTRTAETNAR